ncbi:MAG TPA: hypothetical protein VIV82_02670 [Verrucomicrobiae bacterium]|jgi:hypothetical protein
MGTGQIRNPDAKKKTKKPLPRLLFAENQGAKRILRLFTARLQRANYGTSEIVSTGFGNLF